MLSDKQTLTRAALYAAPILLLLLLMASVFIFMEPSELPKDNSESALSADEGAQDYESPPERHNPELRAVWMSFLEMKDILKNKSEAEFTRALGLCFDKIADSGFNTVIFHARSHGDSFYKSNLFPTSVHFTGTRESSAPFDPLAIAVEEAHLRSLRIEAWINPFRGPEVLDSEPLCADGIFSKWIGTRSVFKAVNGGKTYYYMNPADQKAQEYVINGVREVLQNYDVDGIHFDDYFYPVTDEFIDNEEYNSYSGTKSLADFRRDTVSDFISEVYRTVKSKQGVTFGISPSGNIEQNMDMFFADIKLWGSRAGYVDYLMPQLYWSFGEGTLPYEKVLKDWSALVTEKSVRFAVGLAAYKVGTNELWQDGNILSRQIKNAEKCKNYGGFSVFRYENIFGDICSEELKNLKK